MKTLESWKKNKKPLKRVSKLLEYKNEIMSMYFENWTIEQILEFLQDNKIKISRAAVYNFINKHKQSNEPATQVKSRKVVVKSKPTTSTSVPAQQEDKTLTGEGDIVFDNFMNGVDEFVEKQKNK